MYVVVNCNTYNKIQIILTFLHFWTFQHFNFNSFLTGLPEPRSVFVSVSGLLWNHLLVFGGELTPSDRGHEGAGNFSGDVID